MPILFKKAESIKVAVNKPKCSACQHYNIKIISYMLYKDIEYYHTKLEKPIIINGFLITEIYIDPYYEKHNEEYLNAKAEQRIKLTPAELAERIITNDWIVEFVQKLVNKELRFGKRYDNWVYYTYEPLWKYDRSYCLIVCLEDNKNYIEVVDCYRESKYERTKWRKNLKTN